MEWSEQSVEGCSRFLNRVFRLIDRHAAFVSGAASAFDPAGASEKEKVLLRKTHQTLRRVTHDLESRWHFNSAIAVIMELVNEIHAQEPLKEGVRPAVVREILELLTLMIAPMAPHLSEECGRSSDTRAVWRALRGRNIRAELAAESQVEVIIQFNGKVRGKIVAGCRTRPEILAQRRWRSQSERDVGW